MTDDRRIVEQVPPDVLRNIHDETVRIVMKLWEHPCEPRLFFDVCTTCEGPNYAKQKTWCMTNVLTGSTMCAACYAQRRDRDVALKWIETHPAPKLDVNDFARI